MRRTYKEILKNLEEGNPLPENESGYEWIWNTAQEFEYPKDNQNDWNALKSKLTKEQQLVKRPKLSFIYRNRLIAACVTLLLIVGLFLVPFTFIKNAKQLTYSTSGSEVLNIGMEDGSMITLNGNSKIKTDSDFGKKHRTVYLEGEAYFSVIKNQDLPFIVNSGNISTKVLGTQFNVDAYDKEQATIFVKEGKVEVLFKERNVKILTQNELIRLNPSNGNLIKDLETKRDLISWKNSREYFSATPLFEIVNRLEKISGLKFNYSQNLRNEKVTTTLNLMEIEASLIILSETIGSPVTIQ